MDNRAYGPGLEALKRTPTGTYSTPLSRTINALLNGKRAVPLVTSRAVLSSAINSSTTTIPIDTFVGMPASGIFPIRIDDELMMVTAGAGTTSLTVTRAVNQSVAASHAAGAQVKSGPLGITFTGDDYPSYGDPNTSTGSLLYPSGAASSGAVTGIWNDPHFWVPGTKAGWINQASSTFNASPSGAKYEMQLVRNIHSATSTPAVGQLHFQHDGQSINLTAAFINSNSWACVIDEGEGPKFATVGAINNLGSPAGKWMKWDFGSRKQRRISIYAAGAAGGASAYFGAVATSTQDRLAAWDRSDEPTVGIITDSYGQAMQTYEVQLGPFFNMFTNLGIGVIDISPLGGTGYTTTNGITNGSGYLRVTNGQMDYLNPDILVISLGLNDAGNSTDQANITNTWAAARARYPNALLVGVSVFAPLQSLGVGTKYVNLQAYTLAAMQAVGGPWVLINPITGQWKNSKGRSGAANGPIMTGEGYVTVTTGIGNGDIHNNDQTHRTLAGTVFLADWLSEQFRQAVLALV